MRSAQLTAFLTKLRVVLANGLRSAAGSRGRSRPAPSCDARSTSAIIAKAVRRTNSRSSAANSSISSRQWSVSTKRSDTPSTMSQESNSAAQRRASACGEALRVGRHRGDELRLHDARFPQLEGALVVALDLLGDVALHAVRDAERPVDLDAVAQHALPVLFRADRAQMRDDLGGGGGRRQLGAIQRSRRASSEDVSQRLPPICCTSL